MSNHRALLLCAFLDREAMMANDKSIELRVALQEHQMATAVEILEEIRENYVTKEHLEERLSHFATKDDIVLLNLNITRLESKQDETNRDIARLDTKQDEASKDIAGLAAQMVAVQHDIVRIDEKLAYFGATFATKADLERMNQGMRNWIITVGVSITALQFAMQYALFQLYAHVR